MSSTRFLAAVALAATLVLPVAASAQTTPAPGTPAGGASPAAGRHHHAGGFRRALRTLTLSTAQQQQIDAAFAQNRAANQNVTDPATRKANRQKLRAQVEGILTPSQRAQLQAELKKHKQQRPA